MHSHYHRARQALLMPRGTFRGCTRTPLLLLLLLPSEKMKVKIIYSTFIKVKFLVHVHKFNGTNLKKKASSLLHAPSRRSEYHFLLQLGTRYIGPSHLRVPLLEKEGKKPAFARWPSVVVVQRARVCGHFWVLFSFVRAAACGKFAFFTNRRQAPPSSSSSSAVASSAREWRNKIFHIPPRCEKIAGRRFFSHPPSYCY